MWGRELLASRSCSLYVGNGDPPVCVQQLAVEWRDALVDMAFHVVVVAAPGPEERLVVVVGGEGR